MKYKELKSLYYKDTNLYKIEYNNRFNGNSTIRLPISVFNNQSFVVLTNEILLLFQNIYEKSNKINALLSDLSSIAVQSYTNECLIEEIMSTNDIEGVYNTRNEVKEALFHIGEDKRKRFEGLARKYKMILNYKTEDVILESCKDIRKLYDVLILPEIEEKDIPDGLYFRKDTVAVMSPTQKVLHSGMLPESKIIENINQVISLINNKEIPALITVALVQYYIGYIHPFYDGNGRLGRFIGSYLLSKTLHPIVALSHNSCDTKNAPEFFGVQALRLSYIIKENINHYYKAFESCNNQKNLGDLTVFIIYMLEMIKEAEDDIYQKLKEGKEQLDYYNKAINEKLFIGEKNREFILLVLYIFVQNALFSSEFLDINELVSIVEKSYSTVRNTVQDLIDTNIPIITKKDGYKKIYKLDIDNFDI